MRRALTAIAVALALLASGEAAHAEEPSAAEEVIRIETPAPGHTVEWTMRVRMPASDLADPAVALRAYSGTATEGAHPIELTLSPDSEPDRTLASGTAAALHDRVIDLSATSALGGSGEISVRATATLPSEAGNEYRGAGATLRFRFTGAVDEDLAMTGSAPFVIWAVAVAALAAGLGAALLRRRHRPEAGAEA